MANEEKKYTEQVSVRWYGYIVLILTILFFSGVFSSAEGPIKALDFTNISGSFGSLGEITEDAGTLASDFRGTGGSGARDAWLFALTLVPAVMLALGVVKVVEHLDGLRAAQKLLTPLLMPLLGIPGICGLTLIASLQSTDAGASMTAELFQDGMIDEKQKTIFASFQFSAGATLTNYLSSCAALFPFLSVPIIIPLLKSLPPKIFSPRRVLLISCTVFPVLVKSTTNSWKLLFLNTLARIPGTSDNFPMA